MSTAESMECQEENIPEKMECSEGLNINEILAEAERKLLKYQSKSYFIPDGEPENVHKKRKTHSSSLIGPKEHVQGNPLN